jgi:hypothetical protein
MLNVSTLTRRATFEPARGFRRGVYEAFAFPFRFPSEFRILSLKLVPFQGVDLEESARDQAALFRN